MHFPFGMKCLRVKKYIIYSSCDEAHLKHLNKDSTLYNSK